MRVLWHKGDYIWLGTCEHCGTTFSAEEWELKRIVTFPDGRRRVYCVCPKCNHNDLILKPKDEK